MKKMSLVLAAVFFMAVSFSQTTGISNDSLYKEFQSPGNAARPRVWWHWMDGNVTKEGIRKDIEWMNRVGIGGFQNFDIGMATPQIVTKRLVYMTPEWKDAFHLASQLADSLKMEMAIASSPGWGVSGGPWVQPGDGMKKYVWSQVRIKAGQKFNGHLPDPPNVTGAFQNLVRDEHGDGATASAFQAPQYYEDVATIAYKIPEDDHSMQELHPKISSSGGSFDLSRLTDGDLVTSQMLPVNSDGKPAWVQFEFDQPQTIKALTIVGGTMVGGMADFMGVKYEGRILEASDDGQTFRNIISIPRGNVIQLTISIPEATAKYFRVSFKNPPIPIDMSIFKGEELKTPVVPEATAIAEIVLYTSTRLNRFEEQAGFSTMAIDESFRTPACDDAIKEEDVMDLSSQVKADGSLTWTAPAGNWNIIRFGYSLLGTTNHPAVAEATGLEVDKLDQKAVKKYFTLYLDQYKDASGGLIGRKGLGYLVTDSWEAGPQNWTKNMPLEFQNRRGYSMMNYMPVLTGAIVKSSEASEKFLWDYRKTLEELLAEYHYDALTDILLQYGMKRYSESHEGGRVMISDGMDVKRKAAVPMSAIWTPGLLNQGDLTAYTIDIRESASVAHIYGQNLVAAESFSAFGMMGSAFTYTPENLKPTADLALASGLNRFVIHTSVHQPDDKSPGLSLGAFGQWFTRHETWANQAKVWTDYLSRSSFMLQQGKFVADVVYYYGEENNITNLFGTRPPTIPEGYSYDFINPHALLNLLSVRDGKLVTPSGMTYSILVLDSNAVNMSLPVLRKISLLVKDGANVTGIKPITTPSLSDDQKEFDKILKETWSSSNIKTGKSLNEVLNAMNVVPDFAYEKTKDSAKLLYVHRRLEDRDIYWVNSRSGQPEEIDATFRIAGKIPVIWHPETGKTSAVSYSIVNGTTRIKLMMNPDDAFFIVFKNKATTTSFELPAVRQKLLLKITGEWTIHFQKDRGAPSFIKVNELSSWSDNMNIGIKYFSGTATYAKTIKTNAYWFKKSGRIWIDLGEVKNLAEVIVNGKKLGITWKKPFRVDVTDALKPGVNKLEIKVTNLWVNRLIGDQQPGIVNKITYTSIPYYKANAKLMSSGLLGPVRILSIQ